SRLRSGAYQEMQERRSTLSAAGLSGGLRGQHRGDGVQTLRQFLLSSGSGCFRVGQGGSVSRRYGQWHPAIHAAKGHHLGCSSTYCFRNTIVSLTCLAFSNTPVMVSVI